MHTPFSQARYLNIMGVRGITSWLDRHRLAEEVDLPSGAYAYDALARMRSFVSPHYDYDFHHILQRAGYEAVSTLLAWVWPTES